MGAAIAPTPHVVRALAKERRRGWVERAGACAPRAPMWTSRSGWLEGLRRWAQSPALGQLCAEQRVSITAATLVSIAAVMAEHADHATGRHVAVTRATIASRVGCDVRTVTAAWRVLRASQWAVEAQRGHGSPGTPSVGRRPSVYHLVSRRIPPPVAAARQPWRSGIGGDDFHLPPSGGVGCSSPVGRNSPSGRAGAPADEDSGKRFKTRAVRPPRRAAARPLATQQLAAALVAGTHGLDHAHIGTICDAITVAGIDPQGWTARAITDALNADMRTRGWSWPDHITNPGAFLSSRLRRLDWSAPPAVQHPTLQTAGGRIDTAPAPPVLTDAARAARITAAQEQIRHILSRRAHRTPSDTPDAPRTVAVTAPASPGLQGDVAGRPGEVDADAFTLGRRALDEPAHHPLRPVATTGP
ncbi:rep protein [Mycolicibacterium aromaticivorans]|uniref:rep protein n=1 Tax=Mycolicibacterium aromaticivorans TaxID=318425 RepID=UPI001ED99895|nr:rep protein [Mycolicibacterium aromaticivorans]